MFWYWQFGCGTNFLYIKGLLKIALCKISDTRLWHKIISLITLKFSLAEFPWGTSCLLMSKKFHFNCHRVKMVFQLEQYNISSSAKERQRENTVGSLKYFIIYQNLFFAKHLSMTLFCNHNRKTMAFSFHSFVQLIKKVTSQKKIVFNLWHGVFD